MSGIPIEEMAAGRGTDRLRATALTGAMELHISQNAMKEIVQHYLETVMYAPGQTPKVVGVRPGPRDGEFKIVMDGPERK